MVGSMLVETRNTLRGLYGTDWEDLRVQTLWLEGLYTIVELNTGQVGVALNYDNEGYKKYRRRYDPKAITKELLSVKESDHLLFNTLSARPTLTLCERSVLCAILAALSRPFLQSTLRGHQGASLTQCSVDLDALIREGDIVHVVGFGGYLRQAMSSSKVSQVIVSDLNYAVPEGRQRIDHALSAYRVEMQAKSYYAYDGRNAGHFLRQSDVVTITGSALCNGTMEELLKACLSAREVIVNGHSGVLLPSSYLNRGATHLCWSEIPSTFIDDLKKYLAKPNTKMGMADFIDSEMAVFFTIHSSKTRSNVVTSMADENPNRDTDDNERSRIEPESPDPWVPNDGRLDRFSRENFSDSTELPAKTHEMLEKGDKNRLMGRADWAEYYYGRGLEMAYCANNRELVAEFAYRIGLTFLMTEDQEHAEQWFRSSLMVLDTVATAKPDVFVK